MNIEEQLRTATRGETDVSEENWLKQCDFTAEECVALLWLRDWYQSGGSDRMELVRNWEFLEWLIMATLIEE